MNTGFLLGAAGAAITGALAQIQGLAQPPPRLPAPPLLEHALLENPLPLAGGLVVLGVVSAYLLNQRGRAGLAAAVGAGLICVAVGVYALAAMIRTDREAVREATVRLVDAVARVDEPAMRLLLAEDVGLFAHARLAEVSAPPTGLDREQIIRAVHATIGDQYRITEHRAAEVESALTGPDAAHSQLRVRVVLEGWNVAHNSYWQLRWRREGDGAWRAFSVTPWSMDGLESTAP